MRRFGIWAASITPGLKYALVVAFSLAMIVLLGPGAASLLSSADNKLGYETAEIAYGPIRKFVSTSGPVRALVNVSVGSQLSGQIKELKADFNSEVKAGDVLAVIDDKTFVARVAQAKADLMAARATLANQEAALSKAEAIERNARTLMGRQQTLASKGITATTALDNATRDAEVALAEIGVARAQVENARATIAQREAQLAQAEIDLDRTQIRSPIDGTVISRTVDVGQTVAASLQAPELFKIAQDLRRICIEAQVSEADVADVVAGNAVEFRVEAYPQRRFHGKVAQVRLGGAELNNVVTYTIIVDAGNEDRLLLPGMTASADIQAARIDRALRLPNDALRFKPREAAAAPSTSRSRLAQRLDGELAKARSELGLTPEQVAKVTSVMRGVYLEQPRNADGGAARDPDKSAMWDLDDAVAGVITEPQRPAFIEWKRRRQAADGRISRRDVTVWLLNASGALESREIDLGLVDDRYAEIIGGSLKEGDRLILRSREASPK